MSQKINDSIYIKIVALCKQGDQYADEDKFYQAIHQYKQAFTLIPSPLEDYEASTWVLVAIGDAYWLAKDYKESLKSFRRAMLCTNAIENPFIHLRIGQIQFELENLTVAQEELTLAYMGAGEKIFEDEDPKYLEYLKSILRGID